MCARRRIGNAEAKMTLNISDPEYWRSRAKEARAIAVQMADPHTKAVMLGIAQDYEKLAVRAEQRASDAHAKQVEPS